MAHEKDTQRAEIGGTEAELVATRTHDAICAPWRLIFKCWAAKQFLKWVSPSASSGSQSQPAQTQKFKDFIVAQNVIECNEITVQAVRKLRGNKTTFYAAFNCVYCLFRCVRRASCSCYLSLPFSLSLSFCVCVKKLRMQSETKFVGNSLAGETKWLIYFLGGVGLLNYNEEYIRSLWLFDLKIF